MSNARRIVSILGVDSISHLEHKIRKRELKHFVKPVFLSVFTEPNFAKRFTCHRKKVQPGIVRTMFNNRRADMLDRTGKFEAKQIIGRGPGPDILIVVLAIGDGATRFQADIVNCPPRRKNRYHATNNSIFNGLRIKPNLRSARISVKQRQPEQ